MEQRALGRSGLVVSRLALGTMTWGRDTDEDEAAMQLTAFVDAGGTLVDTAVMAQPLGDSAADEALVGTRWQGPEPLADRDRADVMRAAIASASSRATPLAR